MEHQVHSILNETEILMSHLPDSPSYFDHDTSGGSDSASLLVLHIVGMLLGFVGMLPLLIAMRIARSRWLPLVQTVFQITISVSTFAVTLYKKLTPDLYEGSKHGALGFIILFSTIPLAIIDALPTIKLVAHNLRHGWRFFRHVFHTGYDSLPTNQPEEDLQSITMKEFNPSGQEPSYHSPTLAHVRFAIDKQEDMESRRTTFEDSVRSDSTYMGPLTIDMNEHYDMDHDILRKPWKSRIGHLLFITFERSLVPMAFVAVVSGTAVYTGICRNSYVNGCLAHFIKGGIFFVYGLLTFARYLGLYADLGWAWNYLPKSKMHVSAEFVESFVIFIYGATNTWMERFGAEPGSPYTMKQVQHISIAVMFWFGGLIGMAIESRAIRRWLGSVAAQSLAPAVEIIEPRVYSGSFNPVPAIVIGITGAAMSAHHQTYVFQVQIHALWGVLLAGFAVLRCLTYFLLWLRPPHSILPSRPPTELVASFFLSCGGIAFIFSTEQVTYAAMRRGLDDVMMFLNVTVAITCLSFSWLLCVLSFKGWLSLRNRQREQ